VSRASHAVRRWRLPAALAVAVVAAGAVVALLQPSSASGVLDPGSTSQTGSRALADLLTARGQRVVRVSVPPSADASPGSLELITDAGSLSAAQLTQAGQFDGDILLVASADTGPAVPGWPGDVPAVLRAIAPAVHLAGYEPATVAQPACTAQAAAIAGDAYFYGALLRSSAAGARSCYPGQDGGYALVSYRDGSRTITVLGSGAPLTNGYLASQGDAALCLNLLRSARQVIWVVPSPQAQAASSAPQGQSQGQQSQAQQSQGQQPQAQQSQAQQPQAQQSQGQQPQAQQSQGQRSFFSLVPWPVYLIAIQLCVALLLAAAWRARRPGPLVAERLPVVVRAAETVEGHGRLYQARRARDRAAGELRTAVSARIARLAGGHLTDEVIATRTGLPAAEVTALLHGPPPATDQALVILATQLDTLERKLRQS
jgi:hypothetical protein